MIQSRTTMTGNNLCRTKSTHPSWSPTSTLESRKMTTKNVIVR